LSRRPTPKDKRWMQYVRRRGFDTERMLVRELRKRGIMAYRIPASGMWESRRRLSLPDVLAISPRAVYGFQVKATGAGRFEFKPRDLAPLADFVRDARLFNLSCLGFAVVRFVTGNGSYWAGVRVEPSDIVRREFRDPQNPKRIRYKFSFASKEIAEKYVLNTAQHGYSLTKLLHRLGVIK